MKNELQEFAVFLIALLVALAIALTIASKVNGTEPLEAWVTKKALALPVYYEDQPPAGIAGPSDEKRKQLESTALEIARVARRAPLPPRHWASVLLTVGFHESTYSLRILAGHCRQYECDGGKARGEFQAHRLASMTPEVWAHMTGIDNIKTQVEQADELLRRHVHTCPGDVVLSVMTGYMGKRCGSDDKQLRERMATYRGLRP